MTMIEQHVTTYYDDNRTALNCHVTTYYVEFSTVWSITVCTNISAYDLLSIGIYVSCAAHHCEVSEKNRSSGWFRLKLLLNFMHIAKTHEIVKEC